MKQDGISREEAERLHKYAIIEVIINRPSLSLAEEYVKIGPNKFRATKDPYDPDVKPHGPVLTSGDISRKRKARQYWMLVHLLASEADVPIAVMRDRMKQRIEGGETVEGIVYEVAKNELKTRASRAKAERTRLLGRPKGGSFIVYNR